MSRPSQIARSVVYPVWGPTPRWSVAPLRHAVEVSDRLPDVDDFLANDSSGYPISPALAHLLAWTVLAGGVRNVLEMGAGVSSVVLARSLMQAGGGRLTSIEQSPQWCRETWAAVERTPGVDSQMLVATPKFRLLREGPCHLYASAARTVAERGPYDLLFVDAPQWYYGRDGALHLAYDSLAPNALVVLDDAGRSQERWALRRWLQTYPGIELIGFDPDFGRKGVAILLHNGNKARRRSVGAQVSSSVHSLVNWVTRRARHLDVQGPRTSAAVLAR